MRYGEAAPGPAAQPDPRRVLVHVLRDRDEVLVAVEDARVEAALEEMARAGVAAVEAHRVDAVEPLHAA